MIELLVGFCYGLTVGLVISIFLMIGVHKAQWKKRGERTIRVRRIFN